MSDLNRPETLSLAGAARLATSMGSQLASSGWQHDLIPRLSTLLGLVDSLLLGWDIGV